MQMMANVHQRAFMMSQLRLQLKMACKENDCAPMWLLAAHLEAVQLLTQYRMKVEASMQSLRASKIELLNHPCTCLKVRAFDGLKVLTRLNPKKLLIHDGTWPFHWGIATGARRDSKC